MNSIPDRSTSERNREDRVEHRARTKRARHRKAPRPTSDPRSLILFSPQPDGFYDPPPRLVIRNCSRIMVDCKIRPSSTNSRATKWIRDSSFRPPIPQVQRKKPYSEAPAALHELQRAPPKYFPSCPPARSRAFCCPAPLLCIMYHGPRVLLSVN